MKRILLSMAAVVTAIALLVSGCTKTPVSTEPSQGTNKETAAADKSTNGPVEVTYATFRVGAHVQAPGEKIMLEEFNRLYGDKIKLVIEELPSDDVYVNKMKALAASNSLPDVFDGKNGVRELAIANGTARNLLPYLEEDPEWKKYVGDMAIKANTNEDGNLYSISYSQRIIGYYYNKSMFEKAGIKPAETWEEFMSNCEALKKAGFTPFANATGENAWTVNLLLGAMIGTANEAGNKLMNEKPVTNFNTPEVINALENIKKILTDYSNTDALGAVYANAANVFCQEQAAIIDGASQLQIDMFIVLPLMRNIIGTTTILAASNMLQKLDIILLTTSGGPGTRTTNMPMSIYRTALIDNNYSLANAQGVFLILFGLVAVLLIRKIYRMNENILG